MIPFAKPFIGKEEMGAAEKVLLSAWVAQGPKVREFEVAFAKYTGAKHACCASSGTAALHLALLAVGVMPGDAVVTVSHSFIATANSIRHCGAEPIFVDIDLDTYNMSADCLKKFLYEDCRVKKGRLIYRGRRIAAILPVHQMGMPCDLNAILGLSHKFDIPVVEDAACALGSEIKMAGREGWDKIGRPHGEIACFSLHPRKVITTGEGGIVTTNNSKYDRKMHLLRHHGMGVSDLIRHSSKKVVFERYSTVGYNYRMSDIQAAIGIQQLKKVSHMLAGLKRVASIYQRGLREIPWIKLPEEPPYCRSNCQSFPVAVLKNAPLCRNRLMQYLLDAGISTRRIMNAHQERPYKSDRPLKNSELARDTSLLLPIFSQMKDRQVEKVIRTMKNLLKG